MKVMMPIKEELQKVVDSVANKENADFLNAFKLKDLKNMSPAHEKFSAHVKWLKLAKENFAL